MSDRLMDDVEKTMLEKKIARRIGFKKAEELVAELEGMDKEELEAKLLGYSKHAQAIQTTKDGDDELRQARDRVSFLGAPYREQLAANKELTRLVSIMISDKFGDDILDAKVSEKDAEEKEE